MPHETYSMSVLLPDGETWDAVKVLRCLSRVPNFRTHVLSNVRWPLARFSRYCKSWHHHASKSDNDWIRVISSLVRELQIDVLLPVTEAGVEFVARNRTAISEVVAVPPLSDFERIMTAQDKWAFHCFASQHGLPVPRSVLIGEAGETAGASPRLDSVGYPALLKPTLLDGGFGIVKVNNPSDFHRAWNGGGVIKGRQYMLQSYIPGVVFCLAIYCQRGDVVGYTLWKTLLTSRRRLYFSARAMEYVNDQSIIDVGRRLISALEWDGIANIDFLVDARDGAVKILDFNPRFGQSLLGSLVAGVNFPLLACLGAKGLEYPAMQQRASMIYAHPAMHGKLLMGRLLGRRPPVRVRWRDGSLQFAVRDPLPELVDSVRAAVRRFGHRTEIRSRA